MVGVLFLPTFFTASTCLLSLFLTSSGRRAERIGEVVDSTEGLVEEIEEDEGGITIHEVKAEHGCVKVIKERFGVLGRGGIAGFLIF